MTGSMVHHIIGKGFYILVEFPFFYTDAMLFCFGRVLQHSTRGLFRNPRVGMTSSSQLRRHEGWSRALGRRYVYYPGTPRSQAGVLAGVPDYSLAPGRVLYIQRTYPSNTHRMTYTLDHQPTYSTLRATEVR